MPVGASGYHSPASFHKDDNHGPPAGARPEGTAGAVPGSGAKLHSKLLNMRDFRACEGFPPVPKTRYNSAVANG
jgi:hypothetical protein